MMDFIPFLESRYQESTQAARPIKVSDGTLMGVGVMGCLIWPQSRDEYYD